MSGSSLSRSQRRTVLVTLLVTFDALAILAATMGATLIRFRSLLAPVELEDSPLSVAFWQVAIVLVPLWVCIMAVAGMYDVDGAGSGVAPIGRIVSSLSLGVIAVILGAFIANTDDLSRAWIILSWLLSIIFVVFTRLVASLSIRYARGRGVGTLRALVVGTNAEAQDIVRVLGRNPGAGLVVVGCVASSQAERLDLVYVPQTVPVVGVARDIVALVGEHDCDAVVIAASAFDHDVLGRIVAELRTADADVHISSGLFEVLTSRVLVRELAGLPLLTIRGLSLSRGNLALKRAFDVTVALMVAVLGLPVWILIAAWIKGTSPGPIFYGQERVGRNGERFAMLKFRSMYIDAEARLGELGGLNEATGPLFKMKDDPRVTSAGKWLRKLSLDEFPQILNVLKGEMSLVGPRPPLPSEVERYTQRDWRRLEVVPGMTGLWQVSGRSSLTFDEMVSLDLFYIENWSIGLDTNLILRTIPAVVLGKGAY